MTDLPPDLQMRIDRAFRSTPWIGTGDLARILAFDPSTIRRWLDEDKIRECHRTPGNQIRFDRQMVIEICTKVIQKHLHGAPVNDRLPLLDAIEAKKNNA